jgi:hypothetical protein
MDAREQRIRELAALYLEGKITAFDLVRAIRHIYQY